jgi:NOL1/NOP2/sun family putative RNA methylase
MKYESFIPSFSEFLECLEEPFPLHIRVNRLKTSVEALVKTLRDRGVTPVPSARPQDGLFSLRGMANPGNSMEYFLGYLHPQAFTSCLASIILAPSRDSYVLDMCASPGGKTSHLSQLMANTGIVVANELVAKRRVALGHTLSRLGVLNTVMTCYQAQEFPHRHSFDYILADVPCSGEGRTWGAKIASYSWPASGKLVELQKRIILHGFDLLNKHGCMLYSTCTYNPEENEGVVDFLLKERDAVLLPINRDFQHEPGVLEWKGERFDSQLTAAARFYPHQTNSVGFFMARIAQQR